MARYFNSHTVIRRSIGMGILLALLWLITPLASAVETLPLQQQQRKLEQVLEQSWRYWKKNYIKPGRYVLSPQLKAVTTEGQSYGMLLSVYNDEPQVFKELWQFTQTTMRRIPGDAIFPASFKNYDALFSWKWGTTKNGKKGRLTKETATDGDEVIAYSLFLAARKWGVPQYKKDAQIIIDDLRKKEIHEIQGRYYLAPAADIVKGSSSYMSFNASYIAPEIYRQFALEDSENREFWLKVNQDSYYALRQCSQQTSYGFPPRWCGVRWKDGSMFTMRPEFRKESGFNSESPRIFWHLGMAAAQGDSRARQYLSERPFLIQRYQKDKKLHSKYTGDGTAVEPAWPTRLSYSALVVQMALLKPEDTWQIYQQTLGKQWKPEGYWEYGPDYYPTSVVWFNLFTAVQLLKKAQTT